MLTPEQKRLFVRHILLPEIGPSGQTRLCATSFDASDDYAGALRSRYLARAGLQGEDRLRAQIGDPADAVRGAFEAVEAIKRALGVGDAGAFPDELFE